MKASWINVLEFATSVTVTSQATGFDSYRLYDGKFDRQWKATSTATQTILVNQAASPLPVKILYIPSGHLLSGCTLSWQYSVNGSTGWTDIVTPWVQSGSGAIFKEYSGASLTQNYLRLVIDGASVAPQLAELWMGMLTTFQASVAPGASYKWNYNVATQRSPYSKVPHSVVFSSPMRILRGISTPIQDVTDRSNFDNWFYNWQGGKPFYFHDHKGNTYMAIFSPGTEPGFDTEDLSFAIASFSIEQVW